MNATNPDSTPQPDAPALQPRFPFAILFFVWLLVIITTTLVTILLPESYLSVARIKVERDKYEMADGKMYDYPYDPYFIQTQFEIIQSEAILGKVIEELKLNDEWGKKFGGMRLKTPESLMLLRHRMDLKPVLNTSLLEIKFFSDKPEEAARIANAVAEAYRDYRKEERVRLISEHIRTLEQSYEENSKKVRSIRAEMAAVPGEQSGNRFIEAGAKLQEMESFNQVLFGRIESEKMALNLSPSHAVQIVDQAHPGLQPIRPNKALNVALAVLVGLGSGLILATLVYALQWRAYRRAAGVPQIPFLRRFRSIVYLLIALVLAVFIGYALSTPNDCMTVLMVPGVLFLGGIAAAVIALANLKRT